MYRDYVCVLYSRGGGAHDVAAVVQAAQVEEEEHLVALHLGCQSLVCLCTRKQLLQHTNTTMHILNETEID